MCPVLYNVHPCDTQLAALAKYMGELCDDFLQVQPMLSFLANDSVLGGTSITNLEWTLFHMHCLIVLMLLLVLSPFVG